MGITIEKSGSRIYLVGDTYSRKDDIKRMGGHWDADRRAWWVGVAKESEAAKLVSSSTEVSSSPAPRAKQSPDDIRLAGKAEYKGRTYFMGASTQDGARVRLLTLPAADGTFLDFWADKSAVSIVKIYEARQAWDGRRYSGRTVKQYTTLGSIAKFVEREKRNPDNGGGVCVECGKSGELVRDLEDGGLKHRHCCDIEP